MAKRAEAERLKLEQVAKLDADLKAYDATLSPKFAEWEKTQSTNIAWARLDAKAITDTNGATFAKEADGSIFATGNDENGLLSFAAETDLTGITGLRLEMLNDPRLPSGGPGRAPDGNFVINELRLLAAPKGDPSKAQNIVLEKPLADFSQGAFNIAQILDGKIDPSNGWAISPNPGVIHWATFELREPLSIDGGTSLTVQLEHKFKQGYMPGRFRLSVTKLAKPVGLGLPDDYRAILAIVPEIRAPAQIEVLRTYFRKGDEGYKQRLAALTSAKGPLPEDALLKNLQVRLAVMQLDAKDSGPIAALRMGPAVTDEGLVVIGYGLDGANQLPSTRSQRKGLSVLQVGPSTGTGLEAGEFVTGESMCIGDFGGPAFSTVTKSVIGVSARVGNGSTPTVQNPVAFCTGAGTAAVFTTLVAGKAVLDAAFAASATQPLLESGASVAARAGADAGDGTPADSSEEKVTDGESASAKTLTPSSGCTASGPANTSPWPSMLALLLATALLGRRRSA